MSNVRKGHHRLGRLGRLLVVATAASTAAVVAPAIGAAHAAGGVIISEVAPWGSGNAPYAADWFELTNTSGAAINVTGWKMDDNSNAFNSAVPMIGITSIAPGESVIYLESATPAATIASFTSSWFGGSVPAGLQLGTYTGSGVGLSTSGDAVNVFDTAGTLQAKVTFAAASAGPVFASFDNAAGLNNSTISALSAAGTNGGFVDPAGTAVGSPGTIANGTTTPTTSSTSSTSSTTSTTLPSTAVAWPGDQTVQDTSTYAFGTNMSGLIEEGTGGVAPGVLWAVKNGPGTLYRLLWDGTKWAPDATPDWANGKALHYPDGTGDPDSEGVTFAGPSAASGIFVSTERNNAISNVSKLSVLRFDPNTAGTSLNATMEWNLTSLIPATGANLGLEAITWIPDSFLVANHFYDSAKLHTYAPADYANHGTGLFFVGVEGSGMVHAFALNQSDGTIATKVASFSSTFPAVMELQFDRDLNELWAVCDNTCHGQHALFRLDPGTGVFASVATFNRPTGLGDYNNEGFSIAPASECVNNRKPVSWADDDFDGNVSIRTGNIPCTAYAVVPPTNVPEFPNAALPILMAALLLGGFVLISRRRRPVAAESV